MTSNSSKTTSDSREYNEYIRQLQEIAEAPQLVRFVDHSKRFQTYAHSADTLLQQIQIYRMQDDYEMLFIFLHRFVTFYLNVLRRHNAARLAQNRGDLLRLQREAKNAMTELENLKDSVELFTTFESKLTPPATTEEDKHKHIEPAPQESGFDQRQPSVNALPDDQQLNNNSWTSGSLRRVVISRHMVDEFLSYAFPYLEHGVEFCGILAGQLTADNTLQVTHLLLPKQEGTPDSCHALNEDEVFQFQHLNNLLTLGWIHTHPTQMAFLSSVDLKTQYGYQLMMDEAVAIVCAPKHKPDMGIFRITDQGMVRLQEILQNNPQWSEKHHESVPGEPLFEECRHVECSYDNDADTPQVTVVDLRSPS